MAPLPAGPRSRRRPEPVHTTGSTNRPESLSLPPARHSHRDPVGSLGRLSIALVLGVLTGLFLWFVLLLASAFREPPGFSPFVFVWFGGVGVLMWAAGHANRSCTARGTGRG